MLPNLQRAYPQELLCKGRAIHIADDNRDICRLLKTLFDEKRGYEAHFVHDGIALLSYLKENQDVDAVILDLVMPDADGTSIFDSIRSVSPISKLIVFTGFSRYEHSIFAKEADAFISKTEGVEKLFEALERLT